MGRLPHCTLGDAAQHAPSHKVLGRSAHRAPCLGVEFEDPAADQSKERGLPVVVEWGVAAEENVEKHPESPNIASRSVAAGLNWRGGGGAKGAHLI